MKLLGLKEYCYPTLVGLVTSVGGLTESLVGACVLVRVWIHMTVSSLKGASFQPSASGSHEVCLFKVRLCETVASARKVVMKHSRVFFFFKGVEIQSKQYKIVERVKIALHVGG